MLNQITHIPFAFAHQIGNGFISIGLRKVGFFDGSNLISGRRNAFFIPESLSLTARKSMVGCGSDFERVRENMEAGV